MNDTALVLLDIWPQPQPECEWNEYMAAVLQARANIVRLVCWALEKDIEVVWDNRLRLTSGEMIECPLPSIPPALGNVLARAGHQVSVAPDCFPYEGEPTDNDPAYPPEVHRLVYAGFAADFCLGMKLEIGYRWAMAGDHEVWVVEDATVVRCHTDDGNRSLVPYWPLWAKAQRARPVDQPRPWQSAQDIQRETVRFCRQFAGPRSIPTEQVLKW